MIRITLDQLRARAHERPPDYESAVIAAGRLEGDTVILTDAAYARLLHLYRGTALPTFRDQLAGLLRSLRAWVAAGLPRPRVSLYRARLRHCRGHSGQPPCPHFSRRGFMGLLGRCRACGCLTPAKLWLPTSRCPVGRW